MKKNEPRFEKKRRKLDLSHIVSLCLCVIAVAVILSTGSTFSKMISNAEVRPGSSVAAFVVDAASVYEGYPARFEIYLGRTPFPLIANYPFTVTNTKNGRTAEVSLNYDVIVTLPQALPDGVTVTVSKNGVLLNAVSLNTVGETVTYTFQNAGGFFAGISGNDSFVLMFMVDEDRINQDISLNGIKVSVHVEQIN